jgi:hypothetical protein
LAASTHRTDKITTEKKPEMGRSKVDRLKTAIFAVFILLTVIGAAGCDAGATAIGAAGRAAAHDAGQASMLDAIHDAIKDLDSDEAHAVIGNACQALGLPTPQYPDIGVDSDQVAQVEETIYEEQQKDAEGANEASAFCQAANV